MRNVATGLDVGTSKVCALVAEAAADEIAVLGYGVAPCSGLRKGVVVNIEATVEAMRVDPRGLIAWLGPAIGPRVYEVGEEVREAFVARDATAAGAFRATRPGHWLLDLYAVARQRLAAGGVRRVHGGGLCTYSDPERFFSYRRDGQSGRMAALIWLPEGPAAGI